MKEPRPAAKRRSHEATDGTRGPKPRAVRCSDEVRNQRAADNIRLAWSMTHRMIRKYPKIGFDEVLSACMAALVRAAAMFDPSRGFAFSSYAFMAMARAVGRLSEKSERGPAQLDGELADLVLPDPDAAVDGAAIEKEEQAALRVAMIKLPRLERLVIHLRFHEGCTLQEVGDRLGFTKARAKQVQDQALALLRVAMNAEAGMRNAE